MNGLEWFGRILVFMGLLLVLMGGILWLLGRFPALGEFPGTLRIERPGFTCVVPILGSILLSLILTVVLNILLRLLNR